MYAFNYHRPKSLDDAAKAVAEAEDGKIIAGGMTLLPSMKLRLAAPSDLVDLAAIDGLKGIKVDGKTVTIGAMTRHVEVQTSADVKKAIPALAALAGGIGDPSVRNRGTIGGSVANADPAADYPSAVLGLGATVETNKRKIAADEFFTGLFETALEPGEIIKAIHFPVPDAAAYEKFEQPASASPWWVRSSRASARTCVSPSPAPRTTFSACPRWRRRWPASSRRNRSRTSTCRRTTC